MNSYELSRNWFDWCFENPEKISPNHTALYFFIIEHCNRLGWKEKFGLPTTMAKEAIGIRSYNTYINTLNDLVEFGVINLIEKSKNQYSSNIIAISNFDKADSKALDKAFINHTTKHSESTSESIDSIDKQNNKETIKPLTKEQILLNKKLDLKKSLDPFLEKYGKEMLNEFYRYWTELNKKGDKMRFEEQKFFELSKRLTTWKNKQNDFKPKFEPKEDRKDVEAFLKRHLGTQQENNILQIETPITPHQEI